MLTFIFNLRIKARKMYVSAADEMYLLVIEKYLTYHVQGDYII